MRRVVRRGRNHRTPRLHISWLANDSDHPRVAIVVPRCGRTAVARNRIRRRLRELVRRRLCPRIGAVDVVITARRDAYDSDFDEIAADLEQWLGSSDDLQTGPKKWSPR